MLERDLERSRRIRERDKLERNKLGDNLMLSFTKTQLYNISSELFNDVYTYSLNLFTSLQNQAEIACIPPELLTEMTKVDMKKKKEDLIPEERKAWIDFLANGMKDVLVKSSIFVSNSKVNYVMQERLPSLMQEIVTTYRSILTPDKTACYTIEGIVDLVRNSPPPILKEKPVIKECKKERRGVYKRRERPQKPKAKAAEHPKDTEGKRLIEEFINKLPLNDPRKDAFRKGLAGHGNKPEVKALLSGFELNEVGLIQPKSKS